MMNAINPERRAEGFKKDVLKLLRRGALHMSTVFVIALALAPAASTWADDMEGTWQLVMRQLPDGTIQRPPTVQGVFTVAKGIEQTIVSWPNAEGKQASLSQIDKFQLSETQVVATPVLIIFDDGSGKAPVYILGGETKRSPVTQQNGRVSYQHPTHPPFVVREGSKLTATVEGAFVDYWEKLK